MEKRINSLIEIAEYLQNVGIKTLLEKWKRDIKEGYKFLPFVGRFSSGKSSLLNALMEDNILPTGRMETTAALTKISYAHDPETVIRYTDGTASKIEIDENVDLTHKKIGESENSIESIDIKIPLEFLNSGLTMVDSPGMDTIVNNHVALAQYLLEEALIVVYVMSGSPSLFDMEIMRQLQKNGVGVIAVRTHIDELKSEEESFTNAVVNDQSILSRLDEKVEYFALSTRAEASGAGKEELRRFKYYLKNEVVRKLDDIYANYVQKRLDKISSKFSSDLSAKRELILNNANKTKGEIERELLGIENAKFKIERSIEDIKGTLLKEKSVVLHRIISDVEMTSENSAVKFKNDINSRMNSVSGDVTKKTEKVKELFQLSLAELSQELGRIVTDEISNWAKKSSRNIESNFSEVAKSLKLSDIEFDPEFNMDKVSDIVDQQESILEKIESLTLQAEQLESLNNEQLTQIGIRREEIEKSIYQLQSAHAEAMDAINYLNNNYEPRYIDKPSKTGAFLKRVGSAVDVAMLAIPAIGWEKGAAMLAGKAADLAGKTGKLAQVSSKVLMAGSNTAKLIASTDTTKDLVTLIGMGTKQLSDKETEEAKSALMRLTQKEDFPKQSDFILPPKGPILPKEGKDKPSFFDYLSLSYWFGKFGEWVDPSTKEIDTKYEARYREAREQCEHRAFMLARQRIEEERELGRIKNDAFARESENRIRQEALKREKAICERDLQKLSKKKEAAIAKSIVDSAITQFKDAIKRVEKQIFNQTESIIDIVFNQILSTASQSAFDQLEKIKDDIESFTQDTNAQKYEVESQLSTIDTFLSSIKND